MDDWLRTPLPALDMLDDQAGPRTVRELAESLTALEESGFANTVPRRVAIHASRLSAREQLGSYFTARLESEIHHPIAQLTAATRPDDTTLTAMEETARALRRYRAAARLLGDASVTDTPLAATIDGLRKRWREAAAPPMRVEIGRLVELLDGSDAAAALGH